MRKDAMVCREVTTLTLVGQQNTQVICLLPTSLQVATTIETMTGKKINPRELGRQQLIEEKSWKEELRRALWSNLEARLF
jgi:hypothetical protein